MDLTPDPDPKKYRTKYYVPNNSLWVQDSSNGTPLLDERNLSELANRSSLKDCDRGSETQALVKPKPKPDLKFVLADDLTKGSVASEEEWDGIYRVVPDSP